MWIRGTAGEDLGEDRRGKGAHKAGLGVRVAVCAAHTLSSKLSLEKLVGGELDGHVSETQEGRCQSRVEGENALGGVHLARGIERGLVVPRGVHRGAHRRRVGLPGVKRELGTVVVCSLRHQSGLDDPYRVCRNGTGAASNDRCAEVDRHLLVCRIHVSIDVLSPYQAPKTYRSIGLAISCSCCRL